MRFDLWGSITYGQNLDVKELTGRIPDAGSPERDDAILARRHGLDDDRAIEIAGARSDVTEWVWKSHPPSAPLEQEKTDPEFPGRLFDEESATERSPGIGRLETAGPT